MRDNGSPPPEFEVGEDHSYFMVRLPVHPTAQTELLASDQGEVPKGPTGEVTGEVAGEVSPKVRQLLSALEGELGRAALQERVGIHHQDHFRLAYLRPALNAGLVEMTAPDKPHSSRQRYRLTPAGRQMKLANARESNL
jgi:ATP-dependent DNA helicase RecG